MKYPFCNLVFQGGGIRALAYLGALAVIEDANILAQIERVGGASAGAMLAALVSMRLPVENIVEVMRTFDYGRLPASRSHYSDDHNLPVAMIERGLGQLQERVAAVNRFVTRFGLYKTDYPYNWLQEMVARFNHGNGRATFADFRAAGYRDLFIVATNVSKHTTEIFTADSTPNVAVADALLMSQTIPLFFESLQFDGLQFGRGDYYADGGILLNYPLQIFDEPAFAENNRWYVNGVNWQTLGCRVYTPATNLRKPEPVRNIWTYTQHVIEGLMEAQSVAFEHNKPNKRRTISISDRGVRTTDFDVQPDPHNVKYQQLLAAGRTAAITFLDEFNPPLLRPFFYQITDWLARLGR